ncbi:MAG: hypothetical protein Q8N14_01305 [Candidatus Omnitrophota bacterium]|nr:hypothetical protein [Candidatus Omnitrophota bacterium]
MLRRLNKRSKGQSTAEYAILIGLVIAAAVAMQIYVKRGLQGRVHDATILMTKETSISCSTTNDYIGNSHQYEPYYIKSSFVVDRDSRSAVKLEQGVYNANERSTTTRSTGGQQEYSTVEQE